MIMIKIVWGCTSNHNMCLLSIQKDNVFFHFSLFNFQVPYLQNICLAS